MAERLRINVRLNPNTKLYGCTYKGDWIGSFFLKDDGALSLSPILFGFCKKHKLQAPTKPL